MSRPRRGEERLPAPDELVNLVRAHGSYAAVGRLFGVSRQSVAAPVRNRLDIIRGPGGSPGGRLGLLICAICGRDGLEAKVLRFGLQATTRGRVGHNRYSGALDLCQSCWREKKVKPRPVREEATSGR